MTLLPGCRFAVAADFHLPADWPERLRVGAGVEQVGGGFFPRGPWHPPTTDEVNLLVQPPDGHDAGECVRLFRLPEHLLSAWWELLEQAAAVLGAGSLPGFDAYVARVGEFLAFKGLPFPGQSRCEAVVSDPAQPFVAWGAGDGRPPGLRCSLPPWTPWPGPAERPPPQLWGWINLGEEDTAVVLVNWTCRAMDEELRRSPNGIVPPTVGELVTEFLRSRPDYPPVRLTLRPGEGFRLPPGGLTLDAHLVGKCEPDMLLLVSEQGPSGRK